MQLLTFRNRQTLYCLNISDIAEVLQGTDTIALPRCDPAFEGIFQLRSRIITLLNFHSLMNEPRTGKEDTQIVLLAEPHSNLALRIPGPLDTLFLTESKVLVNDASVEDPFLENLIYDGEQVYHMLSTRKLFIHARSLVTHSTGLEEPPGVQQ